MKNKTRYFIPIGNHNVKIWIFNGNETLYIRHDKEKGSLGNTQNDRWIHHIREKTVREVSEEEAALIL